MYVKTKASKAEATRQELLAVARELFAEHGYSGVGTEEIVAKANVTSGALYYHFRDKRDLFRAVFEQVDEEVTERVAHVAAAHAEPLAALRAGAHEFLDACLEPAIERILLLEALSVLGWQKWTAIAEEHSLGLIRGAFKAAIDDGTIPPQPLDALSHMFLGMLNEAALLVARSEDQRGVRADVGAVMDRFIAGLKS